MLSPKILDILKAEFEMEQSISNQISEEELLNYLTSVIQHYLDNDMEKLIQIMYRLDIDEEKFKAVINSQMPDQMANNFASIILEREKQRLFFRQKYTNK